MKKEYPLVLLHVTLLPIPTRYSRFVLERVLPAYVLENWKLLREKITPTVLERGILIPHPREDYDLLEERLLETLELRMPRILACGHFHLNKEEEAELDAVAEEEERILQDDEEEGSNDADICTDCGRRVRDGRYGSGAGSRRWDIKLYAANGLMRAGAWGAAWREMERVDVEVCPFVSEELKRELELAKEQEEAEEAVRRAEQDLQDGSTGEEEMKPSDGGRGQAIDEARMREIYGDDAQDYIDGLQSSPSPARSPAYDSDTHQPRPRPQHELPLSTLLRNYIVLLSRDPRNLAIALLSLLVMLLAMVARSAGPAPAVYAPMTAASQAYSSVSSLMPSPSIPTFAAAEPAAEIVEMEGRGEALGGAEETQESEGKSPEMQASASVDGFGGDISTTEKVIRAVDGVLDMVGGGGDEIAE